MARPLLTVDGIDELAELLEGFAPNVANNLMRATVHGVATDLAKEAKKLAPKDTGMLRKSIAAKRRKSKPDRPISDVIVRRNAKYSGGYYWFLVEHGTQQNSEQPFMGPAREKLANELPGRLQQQFTKKLEQAVKREQKKNAKRIASRKGRFR